MTPEERARAGQIVAERIELRGLTPAVLSRRIGIDPKTLRAFLRGTRWPTVAVRLRIEQALGWQPGEIMRQGQDGLRALAAFSDAELAGELLARARRRERGARGGGAGISPQPAHSVLADRYAQGAHFTRPEHRRGAVE